MATQSDHDIEDVIDVTVGAVLTTLTLAVLEADVDEIRAWRARRGPGVENHRLVEGY